MYIPKSNQTSYRSFLTVVKHTNEGVLLKHSYKSVAARSRQLSQIPSNSVTLPYTLLVPAALPNKRHRSPFAPSGQTNKFYTRLPG